MLPVSWRYVLALGLVAALAAALVAYRAARPDAPATGVVPLREVRRGVPGSATEREPTGGLDLFHFARPNPGPTAMPRSPSSSISPRGPGAVPVPVPMTSILCPRRVTPSGDPGPRNPRDSPTRY